MTCQNQQKYCASNEDSDQILASAQSDQNLRCAFSGELRIQVFYMRTSRTLIRMRWCLGWTESSHDAEPHCFSHVAAQLCIWSVKHSKPRLGGKHHKYHLTILEPMELLIELHTINTEWSIAYIERSQVKISKEMYISFSENPVCLGKHCRPWWNATLCDISSGSSLFAKVLVWEFLVHNGIRIYFVLHC